MTYEQFWHNGLDAFVSHFNAWRSKREEQINDIETNAWVVGKHIMYAMRQTPLMVYGLTDGKDIKKMANATPYPEKPEWILRKEKEEAERKHEQMFKPHIVDKTPPSKDEIIKYQLRLMAIKEEKERREREKSILRSTTNG